MKGREAKGAPSADLLVCFPSRSHLTLMPKPICSPARAAESNKRHSHRHQHHHHSKKLISKGAGHASPLLWSKTKPTGPEIAEPTSPKVTCAGQIKVRTKASTCKSWQSVMEEIERIHNNTNEHKKRPSWAESMGFKKEIMQFLTCLKNIRFDFRCFGAFPRADITTDDEDEDEDEEDQETHVGVEGIENKETSRKVFSKWFMVLQENQNNNYCKEDQRNSKGKQKSCVEDETEATADPPPNALLLMRCRSAPAKSRFEEKQEEEENIKEDREEDEREQEEDRKKEVKKTKNLKSLLEEEKRNNKENLVMMAYDTDSSDIAKETWIVDDKKDLLSRSRSWQR